MAKINKAAVIGSIKQSMSQLRHYKRGRRYFQLNFKNGWVEIQVVSSLMITKAVYIGDKILSEEVAKECSKLFPKVKIVRS